MKVIWCPHLERHLPLFDSTIYKKIEILNRLPVLYILIYFEL